MNKKITIKKSKRTTKIDTSFKRKILILYSRIMLIIKIFLIIFFVLLFFTNYLDLIKDSTKHKFYAITQDLGFRLENIVIDGRINTKQYEIFSTVNLKKNIPIFSINLNEVRNKLRKNRWIKDASVERILPNTIYVTIVERKPIAIWQINKKLFLIDEEGYKITSNNIKQFNHLIHIVGTDANMHANSLISMINQYPDLSNNLISATRYGQRRWNLNFKDSITVKMPTVDLQHALEYINKLHAKNKFFDKNYKMFDLRDPDKYYVEKFNK